MQGIVWWRAVTMALIGLIGMGLVAAPVARALPDDCATEVAGGPTAYLGGFIPAARDNPALPLAQDPLGRFNALAGKPLAVVSRWEHWGLGSGGRIDTDWLGRVARAGAFPMITWDPWDPTASPQAAQRRFLMRDVAAGAHDAYIARVARDAAEWNGPLFIRFAQEMNGDWYPWGKHQNSPDEYIAAWRHLHEVFDRNGAGQVTWVWNPSEKNHPESLVLWYPGDDVVDWVAVDGYNWDDPRYWRDRSGNTWRLLDQIFKPSFDDLATFVLPDKPRMIAETATTERAGDPGLKATWICDAFRRALPKALPEVKAVLWFQEPTNEGGQIFPWPVDSSEAGREAFPAAVAPPYYAGDPGDLPARLGRGKIPAPADLAANATVR